MPLASLKFPAITSLSYSATRAKDWDDIVSGHTEETVARSWNMQSKRLGKHKFAFASTGDVPKGKGKERERPLGSIKVSRQSVIDGLFAKVCEQSVCVTACGNFGIAGTSTGSIYMWNMQSGIKRKSFDVGPCPPEVVTKFGSSGKANSKIRSITGLASDALNRTVIASTLDGTVNVRIMLCYVLPI